LYKPARGPLTPETTRPIPPKEEVFISAGLKYIAILEHANHPEEPIMHQWSDTTTIWLALQTGQPVPHFSP
jgi:hypothetical protein